ncbi:MAG: hypothetical protein V4638_00330 [Bacteroidota bacterium]
MKILLSTLIFLFSFGISAGEDNSSYSSLDTTEISSSTKIDGRKDRRKKRVNKKRKRACAKWGRRSFAG